jgi:hypothetical protein
MINQTILKWQNEWHKIDINNNNSTLHNYTTKLINPDELTPESFPKVRGDIPRSTYITKILEHEKVNEGKIEEIKKQAAGYV